MTSPKNTPLSLMASLGTNLYSLHWDLVYPSLLAHNAIKLPVYIMPNVRDPEMILHPSRRCWCSCLPLLVSATLAPAVSQLLSPTMYRPLVQQPTPLTFCLCKHACVSSRTLAPERRGLIARGLVDLELDVPVLKHSVFRGYLRCGLDE